MYFDQLETDAAEGGNTESRNFLTIAEAGYQGMESERPPYDSSPNGMAFSVGVWAKAHGQPVLEIKESRGYTWILNRAFKLNFKDDNRNPEVSRMS